MKTMMINGRTFELHKKHFTNDELASIAYSTKDIYKFYKVPSNAKVEIYHDWRCWGLYVDNLYYWNVYSANTFGFTMSGIIENTESPYDGTICDIVLKVTPNHNYAYVVI